MSEQDPTRTGDADAPTPSEPPGPPEPPEPPGPPEPPEPPEGRRSWRRAPRWVQLLVLVVLVLVVVGVVADHIDLDYYVLTPGVAQPVGPLVKLPKARAHRVHGNVFLTDVYITQVTALNYLFDKVEGDAQMLPADTVLGPATPPSQLVAQGYLEMFQSQSAAKVAALTRLGYRVDAHDSGAVVYAVVPRSPASTMLDVGEVVTAVDGMATTNSCAFAQALGARRPGASVRLTVERSHVNAQAEMVRGPTAHETVRLGRWPSSVPHPTATPGCPGTGWHGQGFLGVEAETLQTFDLPFPVALRTTSIGGPSAGLAMTLGLIDALSNGDLTGGRAVAATGTISSTGAIGEVGGIPEKTVAVERAGATVFFVPAAQVKTATSKATASLEVYGVRTLAQALRDLRHLGGSVPPTPASHGS